MFAIDRDYVKSALPARDPAGHKGTFGKVCLLGGSVGYTGAPVQCAVWLDKVTLIPLYGEFSQNGQVVLTVKMLSFTCQTEE